MSALPETGPLDAADTEEVMAFLGLPVPRLVAALGWHNAAGSLDRLFVATEAASHRGGFQISWQAATRLGCDVWRDAWDRLRAAPPEDLRRLDAAAFGDPRDAIGVVASIVARRLELELASVPCLLVTALVILRDEAVAYLDPDRVPVVGTSAG
jgi:hypothetical protein